MSNPDTLVTIHRRTFLIPLLALSLALLWRTPRAASEPPPRGIKLSPESHLWLEGDSTLHKWRMDAKEFQFQPGPVNASVAELVTHGGLKAWQSRSPSAG